MNTKTLSFIRLCKDDKVCKSKEFQKKIEVDLKNNKIVGDEKFIQLQKIISNKNKFSHELINFITNENYACEMPILNNYFQKRFHLKTSTCNTKVPFFIIDNTKISHIKWIDPNRVKEIHLIFASSGDALASNYGHVALRLIVCPKNSFDKKQCQLNLDEHIVLGYMANIDDFKISLYKALFGKYEAHLYAHSFLDIYQDYTIDEFRDIYSIPLKLSDEERTNLILSLSHIHWTFHDKYKFFSQNCASLLDNTFKVLVDSYDIKENFIRPDSLFEALKKSDFLKDEKKLSKNKAIKHGYFFSSTLPYYKKALNVVNENQDIITFKSLEEYFLTSPKKREEYLFNKNYILQLSRDSYLLEATTLMEEWVYLRFKRLIKLQATKIFSNLDFKKLSTELEQTLTPKEFKIFDKCLKKPIETFSLNVPQFSAIPTIGTNIPQIDQSSCNQQDAIIKLVKILDTIKQKNKHKLEWEQLTKMVNFQNDTLNNLIRLKDIKGEQ